MLLQCHNAPNLSGMMRTKASVQLHEGFTTSLCITQLHMTSDHDSAALTS